MNSALKTTATMLILAGASVIAAIYYFPWPEFAATDAEVGKPLFEEYSADSIRGIDIMRFNSDQGVLDRMTLVRRREEWMIPEKQNFIASNSRLVGVAINSLNDRTVYEVISENQEDHIEYGVVDPIEYASNNPDSLGQKIALTDRNNQKVAELIIGSPVKSKPNHRYVRIPGKPRVYTIEFDPQALSTEFALWNSPNALRLRTKSNSSGRQIRQIKIDNYKITKEEGQEPKRSLIYGSILAPTRDGRLGIASLVAPRGGQLAKMPATPQINEAMQATLQPLAIFFTDDVRRKTQLATAALTRPDEDTTQADLSDLPQYGFYVKGFKDDQWEIESDNGQVQVFTNDGLITTISIGKVASQNSRDTSKLNYFVLIYTSLDKSRFQKPIRPEGVQDDQSDQNKAYLRSVAAWQKAINAAKQAASDLNAIHGPWFYLVREDRIAAIRPEIQLPAAAPQKTKPATPAANQPDEQAAESSEAKSPATSSQELDATPDQNAGDESDK